LTDLLCFPNPVTETATFTAGHNRPDTEIDVTITILNTGGSIVRIIREQFYSTGYSLPDIAWDGCNENGSRLARGMYLWRAEAVTADGERASATGRIIIL
jgi:flagellar hook assembly protein FlgD